MAKVDKRRKSEAALAATKRARLARASKRRRVSAWSRAASAAKTFGHPLNVALHITWSALIEGDRRDGHLLGKPAVERELHLWSDLRLVAARARVSWLAARAPEYDSGRGLHLHVAMHLPDATAIRDLIGVVERLTGAPAELVDMRGWSERRGARTHYGIVARSACRGWMVQRHIEGLGGSGAILSAYCGKGDGVAHVEGQHRLSNALSALVKQAA